MVAQPIPGLEGLEPDWSQAATAAVDLRTWARSAAKKRGVPEDVLIGVLTHESGLDPKAYGNGGGVGQFIESTARGYGTTQAELRANPHKAVDLAAQLLRDNADMFEGDYDKAAAAYFIGGGNVTEATRRGGANWLGVADQLAQRYQQGSVSSYLSKVHGVEPSGSPAARSAVKTMSDYAFPVEGYKGKVDLHWGSDKGGADLFAERGTPVKAMRGGTVTSVGSSGLGGNNVSIRGTDGKDYYYAHGDRAPEVKVGQQVPTGQYLFGVGDSGNAAGKGTHLHIGIGNGIISGSGATGGSGRDFDATALLQSVLSGSPVAETPSGSAAAASATRSMLGDQTVVSQPKQNVFEMLADAREQREQELERITNVEPLADVTGTGGEPGGIEPLAEVEGLGSSAPRASLAPPGFDVPDLAPAPQPLDAGPPPLPPALEPPPLAPQSIRPPNVGEAGLAMLPGAAVDQDTQPTEEPPVGGAWGRAATFGHGSSDDVIRAANERKYQDETNALVDKYTAMSDPARIVPETLLQHDELRRELIERTGVDPDTGGPARREGGDLVERAMPGSEAMGPRYSEVERYDRLQQLRDEYGQPAAPEQRRAGRERLQGPRAQLGNITPPQPDTRQEIINLGGIDPETGAPVMRGTQHFGPELPAETSPYVPERRGGTETPLAQLEAARAGRTDYAPAVRAVLTAAPMILSGPSGSVGLALQGEAERLGAPKALSYAVGSTPFAIPTLEGGLVRQGLGGAERASLSRAPSLTGRFTTQAIRNPSNAALLTRAALSAPAQGLAAYEGEKVDEALGLPQLPGLGGLASLAAGAAAERGVDIGIERYAGRYRPPPARGYHPEYEPMVEQAEAGVRDFAYADPFNPTAAERAELSYRLGELYDAQDYRAQPQQGPKKDAAYWGARIFTDLSNPTGTALRVIREGLTGARGPLGPLSGVRRAQEARDEEQANIMGRTAQDARYGARVRADILEVRGQREIDVIESNLKRMGATWAEFGDNQRVFEPDTPLWQRQPEDTGGGATGGPRDTQGLIRSMREAVQGVRDARAGMDTRGQMGVAQRRLRGGGGLPGTMEIVPGRQQRFRRDAPENQNLPTESEVRRAFNAERGGFRDPDGPTLDEIADKLGVRLEGALRDNSLLKFDRVQSAVRAREALIEPTLPTRDEPDMGFKSYEPGGGFHVSVHALERIDPAYPPRYSIAIGRDTAREGYMRRNPGGASLSGLRGVGELLNELRASNPDVILEADPSDARRRRIYTEAGFEAPNEAEMNAGVGRSSLVLREGLDTTATAARMRAPVAREGAAREVRIAREELEAQGRMRERRSGELDREEQLRRTERPSRRSQDELTARVRGEDFSAGREAWDEYSRLEQSERRGEATQGDVDEAYINYLDRVRHLRQAVQTPSGFTYDAGAPIPSQLQGPDITRPMPRAMEERMGAPSGAMGIVGGGGRRRPRTTAAGSPEYDMPAIKLTKGLPTLSPKVQSEIGPLQPPPAGEPKGFVQQPEAKAKAVIALHNHPELHEHGPASRKGMRVGNMWVGDLPETADWVSMTEDAASVEQIMQWARYYKDNRDYLASLFQMATPEETKRYQVAFNRGNVHTSSEDAAAHVFNIEDRLAGLPRQGVGSMNAKSIRQALEGTGETFGMGPKISDFDDSHLGKTTRSWAGDDPRAGSPFTGDTHSSRDAGYIDSVMARYIQKHTGKTLKQLGLQYDKVPVAGNSDASNGFNPSDAQFELINRWGNKVTKELNAMNGGKGWLGRQWTTEEVQAVGWGRVRKELGEKDSGFQSIRDYNTRTLSIPWVGQDARLEGLGPATVRKVTDSAVEKMMKTIGEVIPQARLSKVPGEGLEGGRWNVVGSVATMEEVAKAISHLNERPVVMYRRGQGSDRHVDLIPDERALSAAETQALAAAVQPFSRGISYTEDGVRVFGIPGGERGQARLIAAIDQAMPDVPLRSEWGTGQVTPIGEGGAHADYLAEIAGARPDAGRALSDSNSLRRGWLDEAVAEHTGGAGRAPRGAGGGGGPSAGIVPAAASPTQGPGWLVRAAQEAAGAIAAPLSLKSSLSPPFLRQGLARVLNNPKAAAEELAKSLRAGVDVNYARQIQDEIAGHEWVQQTGGAPPAGQQSLGLANPHAGRTYLDAKGTLLDPESANPDLRPEERASAANSAVGRALERIPGQGLSSRQAAVELNLHRTNWYAEVASRMEKAGITDPKAYEELVKTIEQFTQRGSWGQPTKVPLFFSTRAMSGRIQQAWRGVAALRHPADVFLPERFGGKPGAAQQAGRTFISMIGANTAMLMGLYQAASLAGADPEFEMDGKLPVLKVGHTRYDPWAGLNTPARTAIGIITDTIENEEGGLENAPQAAIKSLGTRGQKFLRGGLSPVAGIGVNTYLGRDYIGQKYNLAEQVKSGQLAKEGLTPFIVETLLDAYKEDGALAVGAVAAPAFLSAGINSYTTPEDKANDISRQTFNGRKYDTLSAPEKLQVVDKLPEEHKQRIYDAKRDEYKADLEKAGWVEPEPEPKDRQETTAESKARAERNKPINKKNAELIADNPELELQRWFFANKHGGTLKNQDAVNQALAMGLPDREVKYEKLDRVLTESPKMTEAWKVEGERVRNFLDDDYLVNKYAKTDTPVALKNDTDYKGKTIPAFDQLPEEKQRTVLSYIRREVRQDSAVLDARLAYFGYGPDTDNKRYTVHSAPASAELKRLRDTYGADPAKKDYKFWAGY